MVRATGGNSSAIVLNVVDPAAVVVAGTVTRNGVLPATTSCASTRGVVYLKHETNSHYDVAFFITDCTSTTQPYTWSGAVRPGKYKASVEGRGYSALPHWLVPVPDVTITGPISNLVLLADCRRRGSRSKG